MPCSGDNIHRLVFFFFFFLFIACFGLSQPGALMTTRTTNDSSDGCGYSWLHELFQLPHLIDLYLPWHVLLSVSYQQQSAFIREVVEAFQHKNKIQRLSPFPSRTTMHVPPLTTNGGMDNDDTMDHHEKARSFVPLDAMEQDQSAHSDTHCTSSSSFPIPLKIVALLRRNRQLP